MKKNLLFLLILMLATGLTAGCSLFGDDDEVTAASGAQTVNLAGTVPATFNAAAPGRNLALNASTLTAVAVNADTGADLASAAVTAARTYTLPVSVSAAVRVMIQIRSNSRAVLSKFVGALQVPTATRTIAGITVDAESTAKAMVVAAVIAKGTTNQTVAEKAILSTPIQPDSVSSLAVTDPADAQIDSLAAANPTIATLGNNLQAQVTAIVTAMNTVADPSTVLTTGITNPANLTTVTLAALTAANTTPAVEQAIVAAGVNSITIPNEAAVALDGVAGVTVPTVDATELAAIATTLTTQTALATVPYISSIYLDGTATKKIYDAATGAASQAAAAPTSPITLVFSEAVDLTNVKFKIRVTETIGSTVTAKTVSHNNGTLLTGEVNWMTAFGSAPAFITTNQTTITITPGAGTVKPGWNGTSYSAATIKIELLQFEGATKNGVAAVLVAPPINAYGTYTTPALQ